MDYNHWAALGLLGEILPHADNRVELAQEEDRFGLPVAKVTFSLYNNDKKLIEFAPGGRSWQRSASIRNPNISAPMSGTLGASF